MVCFTPLKAYRGSGGTVVFSSKEGFGDLPLDLPCGQCTGCLVKRAREWAIRCVHEASLHERSCFLTLTYRNEISFRRGARGAPPVRYGLPADGSLDLRHWQLFAKRMRKEIGPFRFLSVGEYGAKNFRPHYHALVFGQDFSGDRQLWKQSGPHYLYTSRVLADLWGHGFCSIGSVDFESAAYVARYCLKKHGSAVKTEPYRRIDLATGEEYYVRREFTTMSRRPGIGAGWFAKFRDDLYPSDEVVHDGRRFGVPRYYDSLEEARISGADAPDELLDEFLALKAKRPLKCSKVDSSVERLRERELVSTSSLSVFKRELD